MFKLPYSCAHFTCQQVQFSSVTMLARLCSKSFKLGFISISTKKFQMYKLHYKKAEEPEIKQPISAGSYKKQGNSRKTSTSASLPMLRSLTMWITTDCGKFLEMGIPDHLTCLLRILYAGQEVTGRTEHGTMDWFQIGKRVCQGYILSFCLLNLYGEYIM